jgi:hypothetical protein
MRRLGVESGTAGGLRPKQKENLDGLLKRFFIDGERSLLIEAPRGWAKPGLLWRESSGSRP